MTKEQVDKYKALLGKTPSQSITLAKGIDVSDNKVFWDGLIGKKQSELVITVSQSGTPQVRWTVHDPTITSIALTGAQGKSPTKKITLVFTKITVTPLV
jgi:type VI protein secretion system component Hcp